MTSQHWAEFADWHPADIYAAFYPEVDQNVGLTLQNLAQRKTILATPLPLLYWEDALLVGIRAPFYTDAWDAWRIKRER